MATKIAQVRYYGENHSLNQPLKITGANLRSGSVFSEYMPIKQLGIQTMPGVKFYLNNSIEPIIVGTTGIYELNVENMTEITTLNFDNNSINMIKNSSASTSYIIVDILYEHNS